MFESVKLRITDFQNHRARLSSDFSNLTPMRNTMFTFCEQVPTSEQEEKPPLPIVTITNRTLSASFSKRSWPRPPAARWAEPSGSSLRVARENMLRAEPWASQWEGVRRSLLQDLGFGWVILGKVWWSKGLFQIGCCQKAGTVLGLGISIHLSTREGGLTWG